MNKLLPQSDPIVYPINTPAIRVSQPLGEFFITKLPASVLLEVTFPDPLRVEGRTEDKLSYLLKGAQRRQEKQRLTEIGKYISSTEAAFPNAIILGANYNTEGNLVDTDDNQRWKITAEGKDDCLKLTIPSNNKLASIIDGQHRLDGFEYAAENLRSMELLCAIYLDLPNPYQAYLFATINFNQKKVSRSQAFELFAFDLENEPPAAWSPDKTAVYICRRLNTEEDSPLYGRIIVAARDSELLFTDVPKPKGWQVSMSTIVDGVMRLFSSKPKEDKYRIDTKPVTQRSRRDVDYDSTPLRDAYKNTNDIVIYTAVKNYFTAVNKIFWEGVSNASYIKRTVGVQALLDVLIQILTTHKETKDISVSFFETILHPAQGLDFSGARIQASGIGRSQVRNEILEKIEL